MASQIGSPFGPSAASQASFKEQLDIILTCPECLDDPPNLIEEYSSGDMVCGSCGLVLGGRIIDTRSEWRTFANDDHNGDDPSRVGSGPNMLLDGNQLETSIAFDGKGARNLTHTHKKQVNDKTTKALLQAYGEISQFTDTLGAGRQVAEAAKHIYKVVEDGKIMRGKPQEVVIAGCLFLACRHSNVPRTFNEIHSLTKVAKKEIGRIYKAIESYLLKSGHENLVSSSGMNTTGYKTQQSTSAEDLCARYCSNLRFRNAPKIEKIARLLAEKSATVSNLGGRSPLSVAAACIYFASHLMLEPRTTGDIARVAGVSDGTVKTAYKFLYCARGQLIEDEWLVGSKGDKSKLPPS